MSQSACVVMCPCSLAAASQLFGIQEPHQDFVRFERDLDAGRHVFFVDITPEQEAVLSRIVSQHPGLQAAGSGQPTPEVVVEAQKKFNHAMQVLP